MPDYDYLWKTVISDLFEEFLLFFAPDLYEMVDFSHPPEHKEQEFHKIYPDAISKNREVDKLIGVKLKDGKEQWILIHIEIQGDREEDFPKRMFQYYYRILDRYDQDLYTLAIYSDSSPTFKPDHYCTRFFGTELTYTYNTYKILDQNEKELLQSRNPFALAILAGLYLIKGKNHPIKKFEYKKGLVRLLFKEYDYPREKVEMLLVFIDHLLVLPEEESGKLAEEIYPFIEKEALEMGLSIEDTSFAKYYKKQGVEEGKNLGKVERSYEIARNMVNEGFSVEVINKMTGIEKDEILKLIKRL
ncbi:hypothetical protein [Bacillus sp. REN16]|uniref:hypothetical protein n=1 Tax=Bacillus sp. REN16 TaxID=2887296 RepID=UPI001E588C92|nr:hypothetical protein [Bacillus sp. REN16]MCC3356951.1 hypothetical protein [Bacillus sp. REN16]